MVDTLLITITGPDRPGVTTSLLEALAPSGFAVLDIEQVVIRGHLVLGLLLSTHGRSAPERQRAMDAVCGAATSLNLVCEMQPGAAENDGRRHGRLLVTVIGNPLCPAGLGAVASAVASRGGNIDRIVRVASKPVTALELEVSGSDHEPLRQALASVAAESGVDLAVQESGLGRRGSRLVVMDVDSTLIQDEVIELIAAHAGCEQQVADVTERAMRGELDFAESLRERVALLAGTPVAALESVREQVRLTPGARTLCSTLRQLGNQVALVSGGFHEVVDSIAAEVGVADVRANRLEVKDGVLTGRTMGPIIDRAAKASARREFAAAYEVPIARTVAIGDGANDLDMLAAAGLGIAFNAKPVVRQQAHTAVNVPYLDTVLYLLGITREEIEGAELCPPAEPAATS